MKDKVSITAADECGGYPDTLIACPDFVLSTLAMTVSDLLEETVAPLGLRIRHYRALRLLNFEGPQFQGHLRSALGVDRTTVVALVDYLEGHGLAKRERSRADRRVYVVKLTPKGRKLAKRATDLVNAAEKQMYAPLDARERRTLQDLSLRLLGSPGPIAASLPPRPSSRV